MDDDSEEGEEYEDHGSDADQEESSIMTSDSSFDSDHSADTTHSTNNNNDSNDNTNISQSPMNNNSNSNEQTFHIGKRHNSTLNNVLLTSCHHCRVIRRQKKSKEW